MYNFIDFIYDKYWLQLLSKNLLVKVNLNYY